MQRPIVFLTLLFICGIYLGSLVETPLYLNLGVCFFLWVVCLVCLCFYRRRLFVLPCLSGFLIATSMAYYDSRTASIPDNHMEHLLTTQKTLQRISGIMVNPPIILDENVMNKRLLQLRPGRFSERSDCKISFLVRAEAIETASGWKNTAGILKVNLYSPKQDMISKDGAPAILHSLNYGRRVELFGYAFLPKPPTNPHEFDYRRYLHRQMPSVRCLMTVTNVNNVKIKGTYSANWVYRLVYAVNNRLNNTIYTHAFSNSAPLISSMLLGNRVNMPEETIDNFMKTGVIHFIAISGFNVGIVVLTILFPLRLFGINQALSTAIVLLVVVFYAFLTGLNPPVLRASIMVFIFFCGFLVRRQWDITSGIFAAIFFIFVRNPSDIFNIGFQLSALATMGIVYGTLKIEGRMFKSALFVESLQVKAERGRLFFLKKYLRKSFCVSLAAWLATFPLTAYYFHLFTPFIFITNIIVFPLFWIIIVSGVVLLTLGTLCSQMAVAAAWFASNADIMLESLVSRLASIPYSYFYVIGPSDTGLVVYYLFILLLLYYGYLSLNLSRVVIFGLISANVLMFSGMFKFQKKPLEVTCLDVGHGCAIFIQFPNGKNILYDVGSWKNYDVGKYIVAPFLWGQQIKKIDLVILSHEHEDHWNGLTSLMERFSIQSVFSQRCFFASGTGQKVRSLLVNDGIDVAALSSGEILKGFEPAAVAILNPPPFASDITATNDNSCVLRIEYGGYALLLCADIQEEGMESMLSGRSEIKAHILQIPHHGSFVNNLESFVSAVQPVYAFINSGDGIAPRKTEEVLQNHGVIVLQPHKVGAITFTTDKDDITYSAFCK